MMRGSLLDNITCKKLILPAFQLDAVVLLGAMILGIFQDLIKSMITFSTTFSTLHIPSVVYST